MLLASFKSAAIPIAALLFTAASFAEPLAYITNQLGDSVSVIDTAAGNVIDTVAVYGKPAGVAVAPDGRRVYVSTPEAKGIAVLDTRSNKVVANISVSSGSLGIAVDRKGRRVFVADWFKNNVGQLEKVWKIIEFPWGGRLQA